jgi:hypothetical protein
MRRAWLSEMLAPYVDGPIVIDLVIHLRSAKQNYKWEKKVTVPIASKGVAPCGDHR